MEGSLYPHCTKPRALVSGRDNGDGQLGGLYLNPSLVETAQLQMRFTCSPLHADEG